jgi:hypothetical protein
VAARKSKQPKARKKAAPPLDHTGWVLLRKGHDIISKHLSGAQLSPIASIDLTERLKDEKVRSMRRSLIDPSVRERLSGSFWDDLRIDVENDSLRFLPSLPIRRFRDFRDIYAWTYYVWEPDIYRLWHSPKGDRKSEPPRRRRSPPPSLSPEGQQRKQRRRNRVFSERHRKPRVMESAPKVSDIEHKQRTPKEQEAAGLKREEAPFPTSEAVPPKRKRRKGGGMKRVLSDSQLDDAKGFYRDILAKDPRWVKRRAASEHVKEKQKLGVHWRTVQRHIIDPVLDKP